VLITIVYFYKWKMNFTQKPLSVFNKTDKEVVMTNLPFLFTYIKQCVIEDDLKKFSYNDHSITFPTKSIPVKVGKLQVNTRLIPQDVQDHTTRALNLMVSPVLKMAPSPSFSSVASATYTSSSPSLHSSFSRHPSSVPQATTATVLQAQYYRHKPH
jgi:hypothetical protein